MNNLKEDLQDIESALILMEDSADIWQNRIIKAALRSIYHLLVWVIKQDKRGMS